MSLMKLSRIPVSLLRAQNFSASAARSLAHRNRFDESFFGVASNLMRNLEKEFDSMRNSLMRSSFTPTIPFINVPRLFQLPSAASESRAITHDDLIVVDDEGNRKFSVQYELSGFEPEEIKISTEGNMLCISAKKEKKVCFFF